MGEIVQIIFRTLFMYVSIIVIFRAMGKREIGELGILDLVVYIMIAELAVVAIDKPKMPLINTIIPMALLMTIQIIFAFISLKSKRFRDFVEGKPVIIINKGKIDEKAMRQQRYNFDDLLLQLREKNIRDISDVEFAILETTGKLSVIEKEKNKKDITIPLIIDGEIQKENLTKIQKTETWLGQELKVRGIQNFKSISFCSYQDGNLFLDFKEEK